MKSLGTHLNRLLPAYLAAVLVLVSATGVHAQSTPNPYSPEFSGKPTAGTTAVMDYNQMLIQLGIRYPDMFVQTINGIPNPSYVSRLDDPNRPINSFPAVATAPEGNFTDALGHTMVRHAFGEWTTYLDPTSGGAAVGATKGTSTGGAKMASLPAEGWEYTPIDLLKMKNGTVITTEADWWAKRRPEIWEDVQRYMYGRIPDRSRWPDITWSLSNQTTATSAGVAYQQTTVTGTISTTSGGSNFVPYTPRNQPVISFTVRVPLSVIEAGNLALHDGLTPVRVPCMIGYGTQFWDFTAAQGWATANYAPTQLQPDSGGQNMSSYIIGLINQGNWRKPDDWGALAAWGWGISRFLDYLENGGQDVLFIEPTKIGVEGHSRYGKATIVTAAYDSRIAAAFPSCSGAAGAHMNRREWGEAHESIGGSGEYHWVAGNWMIFNGSLRGNDSSVPRRKELMPVDGHSVVALVAPRGVFLNGGTDTPVGRGDAWQDPRGMFLAGWNANPVYELLGKKGLVIPEGTVFTSGAGEAIGGTPPFGIAFSTGNIGWRRHIEGHTATPDLPAFVDFSAKFLNATPPVPQNTLSNFSIRATLASNQTLIVGAVVAGGTKDLLLRGGGPALNQFGLTGMVDPNLTVYGTSGTPLASNNDWASSLSSTFQTVGAFAYDAGSKDAALVQSVSGPFSTHVRGTGAGSVLVEVYDTNVSFTGPRMVNGSARSFAGTGSDVLIAGFVVSGTGSRQVLIRAIGPSLNAMGVTGTLADPKVAVYDSKGVKVYENDNWSSSLTATFTSVGAFSLPADSKDAAVIATLSGGTTYSVHVSGADGGTGEALVEVYEMP